MPSHLLMRIPSPEFTAMSERVLVPVKVVSELEGWVGHSPEQLKAMRDGLADLERRAEMVIYD